MKIKKLHPLIILSFIILAILSNIMLVHSHILFDAFDLQFHLKRISELIASIKYLQFSPFSFNQFNGSAVLGFYPYINLLPIVLLSYFIKSKIILVYSFFTLNTFISLLIAFFSSVSVSKNKWTSYVFSVIYSLSTVLIGYNYIFSDFGMSSAVTFLPLVIFGFIHLLNDNRYIELTLGIVLITYCHILSAVIAISFVAILLVINYKAWTKYLWKNVAKSFIITILLTSIEWLPIVWLSLTNSIKSPTPIYLRGTPNIMIIKSVIGGISPMGLGTFVVISVVLSLFFYRKFDKLIRIFYLFSIITIFICSTLFPWSCIPKIIASPLAHFQFTYRFLMIPILLLNYIFALIITQMIDKRALRIILIGLSLFWAIGIRVVATQHLLNKNINYPNYALVDKNEINSVHYKMTNNRQMNNLINFRPDGMNEGGFSVDYYPEVAVSRASYINNNKATYDNDQTVRVKHTGYNSFSFNNLKNIHDLSMPLIHYNGEHLHVYMDNHLMDYHVNRNNLITLNNVKKGYNNVKVQYIPNMFLLVIKSILFLFGFIWLIGASIKSFKWNKY